MPSWSKRANLDPMENPNEPTEDVPPRHAPFKHVGLDEPYGPEVTLSHADPVAARRSIWEKADDSFGNFHPAYVEIFEWSLLLRLRSVFRDIGTLIASGVSYPAGWGSLQADCSIDSIAWSARDSLRWSEMVRQSPATGADDWDDWSDRIASAVILMRCGPDIAMGDFDLYLGPKIAAACTDWTDQSDYESLAAMAWMGVMTGLSNGIDLSPGEFATHLPATAERLQAVIGRFGAIGFPKPGGTR